MALPAQYYVIIWITVSCSMILFNKSVLSYMGFDLPIFLTFFHMLFSTIATQIMARTTDLLPAVKERPLGMAELFRTVVPVALAFSLSLIFSNTAYLTLSVSFIQMLKATTPIVVLLLSFFFAIDKLTWAYFSIICMISLGIVVASFHELNFDIRGFTYQAIAILCEGTRLVLTNKLLASYKLDPLSSLYYIAPVTSGFLLLFGLYFETYPALIERLPSLGTSVLFFNCVIAFSLNLSVVFLIKHTSALMLTLAGIIKDILLVTFSMVVFKTPVTLQQLFGYALAILGLNIYKSYKGNSAYYDTHGVVKAVYDLWILQKNVGEEGGSQVELRKAKDEEEGEK